MNDPGEGLVASLDALEALIHAARSMPMSASVLISREEALALVAQARAELPDQLSRADEILSGADAVLTDAQVRADQIVRTARDRAFELVSTDQVVLAAQARAEQILAEAESTAAGLRHDADDYCDRRLADFEIDLGRVLAQVQAGRAKLAGRLQEPET